MSAVAGRYCKELKMKVFKTRGQGRGKSSWRTEGTKIRSRALDEASSALGVARAMTENRKIKDMILDVQNTDFSGISASG
jgi:cob(I)alamin adenosyltransferase